MLTTTEDRERPIWLVWHDAFWALLTTALLGLGAMMLCPSCDHPGHGDPKRSRACQEIASLEHALQQYRMEYGVYPTGTQPEIMQAMMGHNAQQIVFLEVRDHRMNEAGVYLDPWGSPFQINTTLAAEPRIYSFGKNKRDEHGAPESDDLKNWQTEAPRP